MQEIVGLVPLDRLMIETAAQIGVAGQITALERATIMAALEPDVHFIPGQVELANLQERFGDWTDDDHPWHELVDIAVDRSPVTENGTIHEWAARFAAII